MPGSAVGSGGVTHVTVVPIVPKDGGAQSLQLRHEGAQRRWGDIAGTFRAGGEHWGHTGDMG